jgi:hypothetical protein
VSTITREQLGRLLAEFEHTAYRLERLDAYAEDSESAALASFTAGQEPDIYPGKRGWLEKIRAAAAAGRVMQRVHVITEPLSPYLQFEIGWSYSLNVDAGEDIRLLLADRAPAVVTQAGDYWLLDSRTLIRMEYDSRGRLAAISRISDADAIITANYARDAALHYAVPLKQYAVRLPQLLRAS